MKKILFTHSYFLRFDPKQWATGQPYAPLGTLYAAALTREHGYDVHFFDTMFARQAEEIIPQLENIKPDFFVIYDDGFNYLTKMCLTNMREAAFKMIRFAKERGCTVIVSSSDSTDRFEMYLNEGADFILLGEAEQTLLELVNSIGKNETDFFHIEGLAFKHNNADVKTARRSVMKELDTLPFPAWDLVDMEPYRNMWLKHAGYFSMNMGTTRGCPFKCNWCAKPIYGNRYNVRSPENAVAELMMLKEKYNFDHIWFCDDIFGLKPGWVNAFANLVEKNKLHFKFKMQGRVDLLLQENNIKDLARAGCDNIWMGAESGSQKILDAMDKGTTVEQIYEATHLLKKTGIKPSFFIQFGYLNETRADIEKTIGMINKLLPYEIGISVSYPLPGTGFYEKVKDQLKEKTNWTDSDELALMFSNTFKPAFYKQLHTYVHKTYRKHVAFENLKQLFLHPFKSNVRTVKKAVSGIYYLPAAFFDKQKLRKLEKAGA
ncbi:MAG: B12-binding domain-containing radical SAM protein [Chitinophagaceae bacterium]|nr:B12-binding domain-containing radical SAM protein [Chitinophagaceae bacterium]